jgi:hypothetical protein
MELERIVGEARRQAAQTPHEPSDIEALYRRGDDGQRVCALVIAQEFPSESLDGIVRDAIANSRSAFEQYHAVAAASRLVPQLDPPRRRKFADFLRKQLSDNKHLKGTSDRKRFVDWLVAELAEHSEASSF